MSVIRVAPLAALLLLAGCSDPEPKPEPKPRQQTADELPDKPRDPKTVKAEIDGDPPEKPRAGPPRAIVDVDANNEELFSVLDAVAKKAGVTVGLETGINERVTIKLTRCYWRDALDRIAAKAGCEVKVVAEDVSYVVGRRPAGR